LGHIAHVVILAICCAFSVLRLGKVVVSLGIVPGVADSVLLFDKVAGIIVMMVGVCPVAYAGWECNKEGAEEALSHCKMVRYLFNASHRICCSEQQIQVYFDTTGDRFSSFIEKFRPSQPFLLLCNWGYLPGTA
jgi:hypothetical protein